jgi:hypothetical protein
MVPEMIQEQSLSYDVLRSVLLSTYIRAWGMPQMRTVSQRQEHRVEVYFFPAAAGAVVSRYVTVGVSDRIIADGKSVDWELLMVVPADGSAGTHEEITAYLLDIMAFSFREDVDFQIGEAFPPSALAPPAWAARAFLVDEPRAEQEFLASIRVGMHEVKLLWMVPIHADEFELIKHSGLEAYDEIEEASEWSPADPLRASYLRA